MVRIEDNIVATFSERLKNLRKDKDLSQKLLAQEIGIGEKTIQSYELELRTPTLNALIALADYFDISIDYLAGRSDDPARH